MEKAHLVTPEPEPESPPQRRGLGKRDRPRLLLYWGRDGTRVTLFHTCSPGPASLASKSLFLSGEIEAQGSQSAWPGPQEGGDPEKHRKAPNQ